MEDSLWHNGKKLEDEDWSRVLILILMEDSLWHVPDGYSPLEAAES